MKVEKNPASKQRPTLRDKPFAQLLASDPELAAARREYVSESPEKRRAAAQWEYDSGMAQDLFSIAIPCASSGDEFAPRFESGILALAIDPLYAPALLTVGSLEYQHGRVDAAMELFLMLMTLRQTEPELTEIIDKAGSFLLNQEDCQNAKRLYRTAAEVYPTAVQLWSGLSYCLGKMGELEEAVATARKALALDERNPYVLNDLGWTLVLAGFYDEARAVLQQAAESAPPDYDLPRNNLQELAKRVEHQFKAKKGRS